jgi:hypothetical protein
VTDRIPLDHLTSDQYDQLCDELEALRAVARGYCPHCGRGDAAPTVDDWQRERDRAEQAEAKVLDYENRITWHTTCQSCARILDSSIRETERRERAEAALARVRAECDQLHRASVLVDGQPHTDRERGIVQAITRIHAAIAEPVPVTPIVDRPFRTHRQEQQQ